MTEKSQPRERSRLGLTPVAVPELGVLAFVFLIGFLATSIRLALVTIGAMFIALVLGFVFPRSKPYWQSLRPASRIVLIALSVFLAIVWIALAAFHFTHPKFLS